MEMYHHVRLMDMDTRRQFSSMSMSEKRDRLMLLAKKLKMRKRKLMKRKLVKLGNLVKEETSNTENRDTKPKMKLNGHLYKKMFQKAGQKQKMMLNGLLFPEPKCYGEHLIFYFSYCRRCRGRLLR